MGCDKLINVLIELQYTWVYYDDAIIFEFRTSTRPFSSEEPERFLWLWEIWACFLKLSNDNDWLPWSTVNLDQFLDLRFKKKNKLALYLYTFVSMFFRPARCLRGIPYIRGRCRQATRCCWRCNGCRCWLRSSPRKSPTTVAAVWALLFVM